MPASIRPIGDIESVLNDKSVARGGTAEIVFRTWDDATPPFTIKVKSPEGKTLVDRVIRELPTGRPQSAAPVSFLVASSGTYHIRIAELYGKMDGEADLVIP